MVSGLRSYKSKLFNQGIETFKYRNLNEIEEIRLESQKDVYIKLLRQSGKII